MHWTDIPLLKGMNAADCDTPRYHALGNAVAVPVIEWIATNLRSALDAKLRLFNGFSVEDATNYYLDFQGQDARIQELERLHFSVDEGQERLRWQNGGYARKGICIDIKAPEAPTNPIETPLIDVIEKCKPANHYYLSANAAEGILRRVDSQNRTLFGPMDSALRRMAKKPKRTHPQGKAADKLQLAN